MVGAFLYLIGGLVLRGTAIAMLQSLEDEAEEQRKRWQHKRNEYERTIEEHERNINEHIDNLNNIADFVKLTDLHNSSFRVADQSYSLKGDAQTSLNAQYNTINNIKTEINDLFKEKRKAPDQEKAKIQKEIEDTLTLKRNLYTDYYKMKDELNAYKEKISHFNHTTHDLKIAIRDRCGEKGEDWYNRLEERKRNRNQ